MSTSNGKITAPVTILDVARTIGVASMDLGRLCTSSNVNKWSKYKPEQYRSVDALTDEQHRNAVNLVGTIVPYGLFKKTAGVEKYWCVGATVNSADTLRNQATIEEIKEGMKWNYVGQPKVDETRVLGTVNGNTIYATQGDYRCRQSDFEGYDHLAKPIIEVEWVNLKPSDEGLGGLFAKITYNDVNVAEDYGGLTRADLGISGYTLALIGQTVNNEFITETGSITHPRYIIAGHTQTTIDGKTAIGFTTKELLPLMGDVNFFFVLVNKSIAWDIYSEGKIGDTYINAEGWIDYDTYYYPYMSTLPDNAYFVEGSAYRASFPDGVGTVIWSTPLYYDFIYSGEYVKLYADIEVYKSTTVRFEDTFATFNSAQGNMGFTLKTEFSLSDDVRRAYRRLTFAIVETPQTEYLTDNYLNKCGDGMAAFYSGLKPLVRNMVTSSGNYADLYLRFDSETSGCIVYRIKDANGNVVRTVDVRTDWGKIVDSFHTLYEEIILENIVSPRNQIVGFALRLKMKAGSNSAYYAVYTSTGTNSMTGSSEDTTFEEYPILGALESANKYWDIEVLLPDDLVPSVSPYGGKVTITYDVNKTV